MNATAYCSFARKRFMGPKIIIYQIKLYVIYDASVYGRVYTPPMMHQCTGLTFNPFQKSAYDLDRSPVKSRTSSLQLTIISENIIQGGMDGKFLVCVFYTRFTRGYQKLYQRPSFVTTLYVKWYLQHRRQLIVSVLLRYISLYLPVYIIYLL